MHSGALAATGCYGLLLLVAHSCAGSWRLDHDTSSGFCVGEHYGRIPVGGYGYDDEICEKIYCNEGHVIGEGCEPKELDLPGCRLVSRNGHYPNCCQIYTECDDDDE